MQPPTKMTKGNDGTDYVRTKRSLEVSDLMKFSFKNKQGKESLELNIPENPQHEGSEKDTPSKPSDEDEEEEEKK